MTRLVLTNGPERRVIPLTSAPITVGRDPENSITIEGPDVSRRHCRFEPDGTGSWQVVDLGSKNGTYLNGHPISGPSRLGTEDRVTIGDATLILEDQPTTPAPILDRSALLDAPGGRARGTPSFGETPPYPELPARTFPDGPAVFPEGPTGGAPIEVSIGDTPVRDEDDDDTTSSQETSIPPGADRRTTRGFLKDRLLRLNLLSQAITSELDLDRLLDAILDAVLDFTEFERGILLLADEKNELKPVLGRRLDFSTLGESERTFSRHVIDLALKRRDATLVRDGADWDPKASWAALKLKSALCLPLEAPLRGRPPRGPESEAPGDRRRARVPTRCLGALYLDSTKDVRPFDSKDRRLLRTVGAQAAIALQNARLHQQATTDPLTQLANRGFFEQVLAEELKRAVEGQTTLAILLLDIDKFKSVNDRFGHQTGDVVLKEVARRVREALRRDDVAGRYGGEEFVVILPGGGIDAAKTVAQKIRTAVKATAIGEEKIPVTISIGISVFPDHGRDGASLVKRADQALYFAKNSGRDRAEIWRAALDRSGHRQDALAGIVSGDAARDQRNLKVLLETVALSRSSLEPRDYLAKVLDKVLELTRGERALLFLGDDPEKLELAALRTRGGVPPPLDEVRYSASCVRQALTEKRARHLLDAADGDWQKNSPSASIESLRLQTVMCVPLAGGERSLGVLYVDDKAARREFTEADLVTLEALAQQVALAIGLDPRFASEARLRAGGGEDVSVLKTELARLKEENARLRTETQRHQQRKPLPPTEDA